MTDREKRECARCGIPFSVHRHTLTGQACDIVIPMARLYVVLIYRPLKPIVRWLNRKLGDRND